MLVNLAFTIRHRIDTGVDLILNDFPGALQQIRFSAVGKRGQVF